MSLKNVLFKQSLNVTYVETCVCAKLTRELRGYLISAKIPLVFSRLTRQFSYYHVLQNHTSFTSTTELFGANKNLNFNNIMCSFVGPTPAPLQAAVPGMADNLYAN